MKNTLNRIVGVFLSVALIGGALGFLAGILDLTEDTGFEYTLASMTAASILYWAVLRGPLGRAIASMLEGDAVQDASTMIRLEDVEDRVQELSLESQRMLELEERLEFTERLLARNAEGEPR